MGQELLKAHKSTRISCPFKKTHSCQPVPLFYLCRYQFDQMTAEADQYGNELRGTKAEISELNRMISRLQNEIQVLQTQVSERFSKGLTG